ncbi:hypothetical protein O3M35_012942 [Rhynocoris fuscipes]|uniref:Uncharacterized protein n=1 Tax=Rhynocoris fuscipes TaxID=488301 RepID=A0AAW1CE94_9HEMI
MTSLYTYLIIKFLSGHHMLYHVIHMLYYVIISYVKLKKQKSIILINKKYVKLKLFEGA